MQLLPDAQITNGAGLPIAAGVLHQFTGMLLSPVAAAAMAALQVARFHA